MERKFTCTFFQPRKNNILQLSAWLPPFKPKKTYTLQAPWEACGDDP